MTFFDPLREKRAHCRRFVVVCWIIMTRIQFHESHSVSTNPLMYFLFVCLIVTLDPAQNVKASIISQANLEVILPRKYKRKLFNETMRSTETIRSPVPASKDKSIQKKTTILACSDLVEATAAAEEEKTLSVALPKLPPISCKGRSSFQRVMPSPAPPQLHMIKSTGKVRVVFRGGNSKKN